MRKCGRSDEIIEKSSIFNDLINECKHSIPGSQLSYHLRNRIEKFDPEVRKEIVSRLRTSCSPLFLACKKGQSEIVEYLITVCYADIEQKGLYEIPDDRSIHEVTPIWCAAVSGKLSVVEVLIKYKADVNAVSDTGSTPIRSACFMTHLDIVQYLVEHGADINKPNHNYGTCLINSVQSVPLCDYLLQHGADVNARDIQNKTALHYAIQEHRLETTQLLLKYGADYNIKSRCGDDALQMACLKAATTIFDFLITNLPYTPEKIANAHELIGASFLDEHSDTSTTLYYWRQALVIRKRHSLFPKKPPLPLRENYRFLKEFETDEELDLLSGDLDIMRIQSLLIAERILGPNHKDTVFRLMYRGAAYADMFNYQRCIDLWRRALQIRVEYDTILYTDTCFTAQELVRIMITYYNTNPPSNEQDLEIRFHDIISTFFLITTDIMEIRELLTIRPVYKRQVDFFDKLLKSLTYLFWLMIEIAKTNEQKEVVNELIADLIKKNPRSVSNEDTFLHLCCTKNNVIRSTYFLEKETIAIFPQINVVEYVIKIGANVNAKNELGSTPLHIATIPDNCSKELIKVLLNNGAHIDQPNIAGMRPYNILGKINKSSGMDLNILNYITLKCLSANVIVKFGIHYVNQIPKTLEQFVKQHSP